eukprot:TRINITY_DN6301_c0_g1_i1.p1 TRINITY_DN6301_c0_g1~~TRINITY_DN6301_c0_g1_i1.p1  ORF type:complete len:232 (-),score=42.44 TRINITY_DN6301_c0_g1_i1:64-759(-)
MLLEGEKHLVNEEDVYHGGFSTLRVLTQPDRVLNEAVGTGFMVWPAAYEFLDWLALNRSPETWKGRRVLELGAGPGLIGMAIARWGATVTLSDQAESLQLLRRNVALNFSDDASVSVVLLDWREPPSLADLGGPFDVILACDTIYRKELVEPFLKTLRRLCAPQTEVLLAFNDWRAGPALPAFWEGISDVLWYEVVDPNTYAYTRRDEGKGNRWLCVLIGGAWPDASEAID